MTHQSAEATRTIVGSVLAALLLTAGQAAAQSPQPTPSPSPGVSTLTSRQGTVEGTVLKVDSMGGKVEVSSEVSSRLFGLFGTTLQVKPDTQIQVEGRQTSLTDIREGDKVKASYEIREGQSIARSIQITPIPEAPKESPPRSPASGTPPPHR
jgi:Cu/Ag efflux protein CusF